MDFRLTMSIGRKGDAWDNAAMESLFKTLKVERIYHVRYDSRAQARLDIVDWIEGFTTACECTRPSASSLPSPEKSAC